MKNKVFKIKVGVRQMGSDKVKRKIFNRMKNIVDMDQEEHNKIK